jgi:hypothetical protein
MESLIGKRCVAARDINLATLKGIKIVGSVAPALLSKGTPGMIKRIDRSNDVDVEIWYNPTNIPGQGYEFLLRFRLELLHSYFEVR